MDPKGLYAVLEVPVTASEDEIKRAYKRMALLWHPDKRPNEAELANQKFQQISHAYSVLSCPEKRSAYDQGVEEGDEEEVDMDDFFEMFTHVFGNVNFGRMSSGRNNKQGRAMEEMFHSFVFEAMSGFSDDDLSLEEILEYAADEYIEETEEDEFKCLLCGHKMQEPIEVFEHLEVEHMDECEAFVARKLQQQQRQKERFYRQKSKAKGNGRVGGKKARAKK